MGFEGSVCSVLGRDGEVWSDPRAVMCASAREYHWMHFVGSLGQLIGLMIGYSGSTHGNVYLWMRF